MLRRVSGSNRVAWGLGFPVADLLVAVVAGSGPILSAERRAKGRDRESHVRGVAPPDVALGCPLARRRPPARAVLEVVIAVGGLRIALGIVHGNLDAIPCAVGANHTQLALLAGASAVSRGRATNQPPDQDRLYRTGSRPCGHLVCYNLDFGRPCVCRCIRMVCP